MILLLDSTFLIDVLRKQPASTKLLEHILLAGHEVRTSTVTVAEVFAGMRDSEAERTTAFLTNIDAYDVTFRIAKYAGILKHALSRIGRTHDLDDMIVAATAIEYDLPLLTANRKDFEGTGVTFYKASEK